MSNTPVPVAHAYFKVGGQLVPVNLDTSYLHVKAGQNLPLKSMTYAARVQAPPQTVPNAPATLVASVPSGSTTSITLTWSAATLPTGGSAVTGYKVYNATTGTQVGSTLGASVLTTTLTGLTTATTYSYYVTAVNAAGESGHSITRSATTGTATTGTQVPLLGIYHGGPSTDDDVQAQFGAYPDISSTYYNTNQSTLNVTQETARIKKGISPLLTLTSKGQTYLADLAAGPSSAGWAAASAWLDNYVNALNTLSKVDPRITVYATMWHEWTVQVTQGDLTGDSANATNYGKAFSVFAARCRANAPAVKTVMWVSSMTGDIGTAMAAMDPASGAPHVISADPYSIKVNTPGTPASTWSTFLTSLRSTGGTYHNQWVRLGSPPLAISETGVASVNKVSGTATLANTDSAMATWYTGIRQAIADNQLEFMVMFNRNSGNRGDYALTGTDTLGNAHPRALAAFGAELAKAPIPAADIT